MHTDPVSLESLLILCSFAGILWAVFTVYSRLKQDVRETRILVNVLCHHTGIDPKKILNSEGMQE